MTEYPIIFSADMVRAILDGRKTQTRRIVKLNASGRVSKGCRNWHLDDENAVLGCPYGAPGDRLWVRETWQEFFEDELPEGRVTHIAGRMGIPSEPERNSVVAYRADGEIPDHPEYGPARWRSPIHMPRWASRITLEVKAVRIERLQDISKNDAESEGITYLVSQDGHPLLDIGCKHTPAYFLNEANKGRFVHAGRSGFEFDPDNWAIAHFAALWESINGKGSWNANPWVWCVEFERVEQ